MTSMFGAAADTIMAVIAVAFFVALIIFYILNNLFPGWLRRFFSEAQLETIDARIEFAEATKGKATLSDLYTPIEPELPLEPEPLGKHEAADAGGDGKLWVLGDDGELIEADAYQEREQ